MKGVILLYLTGVASFCLGLWTHDWRTIFAGVVVAAAGPLVALEADYRHDQSVNRRERRVLDRLWDDDDLSGSE